jgi:hypothetical protein
MQYKLVYLFLVSLFLVSLFSCDNEVDINDEYEEISVVYGLLDVSANRHYVKITKAFLVDGSVYLGAQNASLSQYDPEDLQIWMDEYSYGNYVKSIVLDTVMVHQKDTGIFYSPDQLVYATQEGIVLNENNSYLLKIKVKSSGKLIEAQTQLIKGFAITKPLPLVKFVSFISTFPQSVEWNTTPNGKLYQFGIRYFYTEVDAQGNSTSHQIDWSLNQLRSEDTDGGDKMIVSFLGGTFYDIVAKEVLPPTQGVYRYSDSISYIVSVADEEFTTYLDVNKPSTSIVMERPNYTNISNGIGIFASRYNSIRMFSGLNAQSLDTLINGAKTNHLGFRERP